METTSGKLKGYFYDGSYVFKGIPYAYAERFQMPVPSHWEGVRDACSYGFVCPLMTQETPTAELMVPHRYWPMDEHCQNLNIWTKVLDKNAEKNRFLYGFTEVDILPVLPLSRWLMTDIICVWKGMW